jgi:hypothetical protein
MYFGLLHLRLVDYMRGRVRSGAITERGLARLAGISQPHLHHVLKGTRLLSTRMADQVVLNLRLTALDLVEEHELGLRRGRPDLASPQYTEVALVGDLGPGYPFPDLKAETGHLPFPTLELAGTAQPVAVRLAPDPHAPPLFKTGDIVLLDILLSASQALDPGSYYAIDTDGSGCLRRVEQQDGLLLLSAGAGPVSPACISLQDRNILEVVRARVIWIGRYLEKLPIAEGPSQATGEKYRCPGQER